MSVKILKKSVLNGIFLPKSRLNHSWKQPDGFNTGINVYNCVTKKKTPLIVKNKNLTKWYTCGPTMYDSSHIGHACCYTKLDIIQGILKKYFKLNLVTVMNITDIDDKIIKKSIDMKKSATEITRMYEKEFWDDLRSLKIPKPDIILRVSDNIPTIIDFIKNLENSGFAYKSGDSIYFDVTKYRYYGKLQNIGDGSSEETEFKRSAADFALWKACKPGEPFWESPWGPGRPGWHIECSALATHAFGSNIDIHAGGIDLRFPHHENEEAQSCAFHNSWQWVNYWLHTGHLVLKNSEKMSKSLKNTLSIQEFLKNVNPEDFRMACTMSHYRSPMEYSDDFMLTAKSVLSGYKKFLVSCEEYNKGILKGTVNSDVLRLVLEETTSQIHNSLCNDFDTPSIIGSLNQLVSTVNSMLHSTTTTSSHRDVTSVTALANLLVKTLDIFSINLQESSEASDNRLGDVMDILNSFRQDVRNIGIATKNQDVLKLCDNARNELNNCGIAVKDHGKISTWSK